jgi:hypothetical protein
MSNLDDDQYIKLEDRFCSVLNAVIDHTMEPPCAMEPEEFQEQQQQSLNEAATGSNLLVPVIRVFGPVHRGPMMEQPPQQSACLYIHGAFPYLLARPCVAGPDGSLIRALPASGHVNWDDLESVERVVDHIATTLEASIQSLDFGGDKETAAAAPKQQRKNRIIRRLSIVQGRGFYSYCPGPPAPFLRVEYYDPKLRWKVKLILERGLELPLSYHPDPRQYDRSLEQNETLKFHCYEAHIPYTMQFFKDWNLSGMAYIHLASGKLRGTLSDYSKKKSSSNSQHEHEEAFFLQSNTPARNLWEVPPVLQGETPSSVDDSLLRMAEFQQSLLLSQSSHQGGESSQTPSAKVVVKPPKKETSCDIEIDCTVQDILNVQTVLTSLPDEQDERDRIQWRAVPSLQEIWRQERRRMQKLLKPQDDFLSHPPPTNTTESQESAYTDRTECNDTKDPPPFTLNVKKNTSRPGARLAVKGMWGLVDVTKGLKEDFVRALSQIVHRHKRGVIRVDDLLRARSKMKLFCDEEEEEEAIVRANQTQCVQLTPTTNEVLDALCALEGQFDDKETPSSSGDQQVASSRGKQPSMVSDRLGADNHYSQKSNEGLIFSYNSSQETHEGTPGSTLDPIQYSQRVERGDCVIEGYELEFIDPLTLRPYDELYFGEDRCLAIFVLMNDAAGTKRICGSLRVCPRNRHCDALDRAKPGYYKTVTTGTIVDGIIDSSETEEDEEDDNDRFEQELTVLATQLEPAGLEIDNSTYLSQHIPETPTQPVAAGQYFTQYLPERPFPSGQLLTQDLPESSTQPFITGKQPNLGESDDESDEHSHHSNYHGFESECRDSSTLLPPSRSQVATTGLNTRLHGLELKEQVPSWLSHAAKYVELRKKWTRGEEEDWFLRIKDGGDYIQPVFAPPGRGKVMTWYNRKFKRSRKVRESNGKKRKLQLPTHDKKEAALPDDDLEIDCNSRKLVPRQNKKIYSGDVSASSGAQNVEEVQWESSQQPGYSQLSPVEESPASRVPSKHIRLSAKSHVGDHSVANSNMTGSESLSKGIASNSMTQSESQHSDHALEGIGNQGGRIHVQGGGGLKAKTRQSQVPSSGVSSTPMDLATLPTPISFMSIEIHVQCRTGDSRLDSRKISMAPNSKKDKVFAVVFLYGNDPGGGEKLDISERGVIFVPLEMETATRAEQVARIRSSMPRSTMGISAPLLVECVNDEKNLLLRLASMVRIRDPDMIISWDTQGAGLGYLIERGVALGDGGRSSEMATEADSDRGSPVDMVRLLGRTPHASSASFLLVKSCTDSDPVPSALGETGHGKEWKGSGLGSDWDEKVGAGCASSSIVSQHSFEFLL